MQTETRSRFEEVASQLRDQLLRGELRPGDRMPSFPQMKARGVSQHTMEKAYALLERDGLIQRESGRGIFVRQSHKPRTGILGLYGLADKPGEHPYDAALIRGVQETAHELGYDVLLTRNYDAANLARMDGVLTVDPAWPELKKRFPVSIPWVSMLWSTQGIPSVVPAEEGGQRALVEYLLAAGHQKIAYIYVDWSDTQRISIYREVCAAAGAEVPPAHMRGLHEEGFQRELGFAGHGYVTMKAWLKEGFLDLGCTAIMAHNDDSALGVLRALREAGLRVPEDISVTGFDGTEVASHAVPPLTTVHVPLQEIGACGVKTLCSLLQGTEVPTLTRVPATLRVAESTASPRQALLAAPHF